MVVMNMANHVVCWDFHLSYRQTWSLTIWLHVCISLVGYIVLRLRTSVCFVECGLTSLSGSVNTRGGSASTHAVLRILTIWPSWSSIPHMIFPMNWVCTDTMITLVIEAQKVGLEVVHEKMADTRAVCARRRPYPHLLGCPTKLLLSVASLDTEQLN